MWEMAAWDYHNSRKSVRPIFSNYDNPIYCPFWLHLIEGKMLANDQWIFDIMLQ